MAEGDLQKVRVLVTRESLSLKKKIYIIEDLN